MRQPARGEGTTADRVAEILADHIRRHRLTAGASMPSEVQSSRQLGVSRGVVREAYRSLSQAGLIDIANEVVGRAANNPLFSLVSSGLREAMNASIRVSLAGRQSQAELDRVIATHALIVDAIEAGRRGEARKLMTRHFKEALVAVRRQAALDAAPAPTEPRPGSRRRLIG